MTTETKTIHIQLNDNSVTVTALDGSLPAGEFDTIDDAIGHYATVAINSELHNEPTRAARYKQTAVELLQFRDVNRM